MKHTEIFDILKPIACNLTDRRFRHVAAIVHRNKIIAFGHSHKKSHPFQLKYGKNEEAIYWHAETNVIFNALKIVDTATLKRCRLYVCRIKCEDHDHRSLMFGLSKPCDGCQECIDEYQIPTLIYTMDGTFGKHHYGVEERDIT